MSFELTQLTTVRVLDVRVLSAKDRGPDDPPGAQLLLTATLPAAVLGMFDGLLPAMLFRPAEGKAQGQLEGIESLELTTVGDHVKRLKWQFEQTGCRVTIDYGSGGKSDIVLEDVKAHRLSFSPRQGGSAVVQWTIDAPGLKPATWSKLPGLKSTEVQMLLSGPTVDDRQQGIEGTDPDAPPAAKPRKPGAAERAAVAKHGEPRAEAGAAFAAAHGLKAGPEETDSEGGETDAAQGETKPAASVSADGAWPFPKNADAGAPPQSVTIERSQPGTRTAKGRERMKAELAAGVKAHGTH